MCQVRSFDTKEIEQVRRNAELPSINKMMKERINVSLDAIGMKGIEISEEITYDYCEQGSILNEILEKKEVIEKRRKILKENCDETMKFIDDMKLKLEEINKNCENDEDNIVDAKNETIDEMIKYREEGVAKCLVVTGCYPQKYLKELTQNYPQVDIFLGTNEYRNIVQILEEFLNDKHSNQIVKTDSAYSLDEVTKGRLITTPFYTAYLKIADGCDNFCSYCTIPYIRGRYRSREFNSLIEEAKDLVRSGVRELIIVAQDITKYGIDNYGEKRLPELLHELGKIKNLKWIRLLYCYPENITPELISEINSNKKICKYIDVPFQHISNDILKAMNRHIQTDEVEKIIQDIKNGIPGVSIRSTFILGFPGETKEHFNELVGFLKNNKLPNVGFFTYSREDGTVAARLAGQVDETTKKRRLLKAARVQKRIVVEFNKSLVGEPLEVLLEGFDEKKGLYFGRTQYQAPDILLYSQYI